MQIPLITFYKNILIILISLKCYGIIQNPCQIKNKSNYTLYHHLKNNLTIDNFFLSLTILLFYLTFLLFFEFLDSLSFYTFFDISFQVFLQLLERCFRFFIYLFYSTSYSFNLYKFNRRHK